MSLNPRSRSTFKRQSKSWRKTHAKTKRDTGPQRFYNRGVGYVMGLKPRASRGNVVSSSVGSTHRSINMSSPQEVQSRHRPSMYQHDEIDEAMQNLCSGNDCPRTLDYGYCSLDRYCNGRGNISVAKSSAYGDRNFIGLLEIAGQLK